MIRPLFLLILLIVSFTSSIAETISLTVSSESPPKVASGILFTAQGHHEQQPQSVKADDTGTYVVTFDISPEDQAQGFAASAVVVGEDGLERFAPVVLLTPATIGKDAPVALQSCPQSVSKESLPKDFDPGPLVAIKDFQLSRREQLRNVLREEFPGEEISRVAKLEERFGLRFTHDPELSSELPAAELSIRLWRVLESLKAYKAAQQ